MTETPVSRKRIAPDMRILYDAAINQGWTVTVRRNAHLRWRNPDGRQVFTSATASDFRAVHKIKRDLKNNGLDLT